MKGCLTVLVLAALFLFSGAWLAGPPVAGFLLETALTTGGLRSNDLEVTVDSEPRFELLGGHADRVRIRATAASYRELSIERLVVDMDDVGLVDRRADQVEGELEVEKVLHGVMERLSVHPVSAVCVGIAGVDRASDEMVMPSWVAAR